jgi:hypothetical protein
MEAEKMMKLFKSNLELFDAVAIKSQEIALAKMASEGVSLPEMYKVAHCSLMDNLFDTIEEGVDSDLLVSDDDQGAIKFMVSMVDQQDCAYSILMDYAEALKG